MPPLGSPIGKMEKELALFQTMLGSIAQISLRAQENFNNVYMELCAECLHQEGEKGAFYALPLLPFNRVSLKKVGSLAKPKVQMIITKERTN